jgi:hypothetical protein
MIVRISNLDMWSAAVKVTFKTGALTQSHMSVANVVTQIK